MTRRPTDDTVAGSRYLALAKLVIQADVNVGDPVVPPPVRTVLPTLLGDATVEVLGYPKVMVVAEKLVTALQRGRANTRWWDFADLYVLLETGDLNGAASTAALREIARHRRTPLRPLGPALEGMADEAQPRWRAWWQQHVLDARVPEAFSEVLDALDTWTREELLVASDEDSTPESR